MGRQTQRSRGQSRYAVINEVITAVVSVVESVEILVLRLFAFGFLVWVLVKVVQGH